MLLRHLSLALPLLLLPSYKASERETSRESTAVREIVFAGAGIRLPAELVQLDVEIEIERLSSQTLPPLLPGMVNVTGGGGGYQFLPAGTTFESPVEVYLPIDDALIDENGTRATSVRTYLWDEEEEVWRPLPKVRLELDARRLVSETTHFTKMINAVLTAPEHPSPLLFNPNSIKDLATANPAAGIDLVDPPTPNNKGTAELRFPIRLPKGRGDHSPQLALTYSSAGGDSWVGHGWTLGVSQISIDTRWGVPTYRDIDPQAASRERYLLDGRALVPIPVSPGERCAVQGTSPGAVRKFASRIESFERILQCVTTQGWIWEVTDRGGVRFEYGLSPNERLTSYHPDEKNHVAVWYLSRVTDANGNVTLYAYAKDNSSELAMPEGEEWVAQYLSSVTYSAHPATGLLPAYEVELERECAESVGSSSIAVNVDARFGFKVVRRCRLSTIAVWLTRPARKLIRSYALSYVREKHFGKMLLVSVDVFGADDNSNPRPFYTHSFAYSEPAFVDETSGAPEHWFGATESWPIQGAAANAVGSRSRLLQHTNEVGDSGSLGVGVSAEIGVGPATASCSIGMSARIDVDRPTHELLHLDLDGDRLADRVWRETNGVVAALGMGTDYKAGQPVAGLRSLGRDKTLGGSGGVAAGCSAGGVGIGADLAFAMSTTGAKRVLADSDGDGLMDLASPQDYLRGLPSSCRDGQPPTCEPGDTICKCSDGLLACVGQNQLCFAPQPVPRSVSFASLGALRESRLAAGAKVASLTEADSQGDSHWAVSLGLVEPNSLRFVGLGASPVGAVQPPRPTVGLDPLAEPPDTTAEASGPWGPYTALRSRLEREPTQRENTQDFRPVVRWDAQHTGEVTIKARARRNYLAGSDGVEVSLYHVTDPRHAGGTKRLGSVRLGPDEQSAVTIDWGDEPLAVEFGDSILLVVDALDDLPIDYRGRVLDEVRLHLRIEYVTACPRGQPCRQLTREERATVGATGEPSYVYEFPRDFRISELPRVDYWQLVPPIGPPRREGNKEAKNRLYGTVRKLAPTRTPVHVRIRCEPLRADPVRPGDLPRSTGCFYFGGILWEKTFAPKEARGAEVSFDLELPSPFRRRQRNPADDSLVVLLGPRSTARSYAELNRRGTVVFVHRGDRRVARTYLPLATLVPSPGSLWAEVGMVESLVRGELEAILTTYAEAKRLRSTALAVSIPTPGGLLFPVPIPLIFPAQVPFIRLCCPGNDPEALDGPPNLVYEPLRLLFEVDGENGWEVPPEAIEWSPTMEIVSLYSLEEVYGPSANSPVVVVSQHVANVWRPTELDDLKAGLASDVTKIALPTLAPNVWNLLPELVTTGAPPDPAVNPLWAADRRDALSKLAAGTLDVLLMTHGELEEALSQWGASAPQLDRDVFTCCPIGTSLAPFADHRILVADRYAPDGGPMPIRSYDDIGQLGARVATPSWSLAAAGVETVFGPGVPHFSWPGPWLGLLSLMGSTHAYFADSEAIQEVLDLPLTKNYAHVCCPRGQPRPPGMEVVGVRRGQVVYFDAEDPWLEPMPVLFRVHPARDLVPVAATKRNQSLEVSATLVAPQQPLIVSVLNQSFQPVGRPLVVQPRVPAGQLARTEKKAFVLPQPGLYYVRGYTEASFNLGAKPYDPTDPPTSVGLSARLHEVECDPVAGKPVGFDEATGVLPYLTACCDAATSPEMTCTVPVNLLRADYGRWYVDPALAGEVPYSRETWSGGHHGFFYGQFNRNEEVQCVGHDPCLPGTVAELEEIEEAPSNRGPPARIVGDRLPVELADVASLDPWFLFKGNGGEWQPPPPDPCSTDLDGDGVPSCRDRCEDFPNAWEAEDWDGDADEDGCYDPNDKGKDGGKHNGLGEGEPDAPDLSCPPSPAGDPRRNTCLIRHANRQPPFGPPSGDCFGSAATGVSICKGGGTRPSGAPAFGGGNGDGDGDGDDGGGPLSLGPTLRRSSNFGISAGVSANVGPIGVGARVGSNSSYTDQEYFDWNGDSVPDRIAPAEVILSGSGKRLTFYDDLQAAGATCPEPPVASVLSGGVRCPGVRERQTTTASLSASASGGMPVSGNKTRSGGRIKEQGNKSGQNTGVSLNLQFSHSRTILDRIDMNGDGLPDLVTSARASDGTTHLLVQLNLGYRLGKPEDWGPLTLSQPDAGPDALRTMKLGSELDALARTNNYTAGTAVTAGGGFTISIVGFSLSASHSSDMTGAITHFALADLGGDGLPDLVTKAEDVSVLLSRHNLGGVLVQGDSFLGSELASATEGWSSAPRLPEHRTSVSGVARWVAEALSDPQDSLLVSGSDTDSMSGTLSVTIFFVKVTAAYYRKFGGSFMELGLYDVTGDGFDDRVLRTGDETGAALQVQTNRSDGANLLKTVHGPLGSLLELDYERREPSRDDPKSRWLLKGFRMGQADNYPSAGVDPAAAKATPITQTFAYESPYYDRVEREFLGFEKLIQKFADGSTVAATYKNRDYWQRGVLWKQLVQDGNGKPLREDENTVAPIRRHDQGSSAERQQCLQDLPLPLRDLANDTAVAGWVTPCDVWFPKRAEQITRWYEGSLNNPKETKIALEYDEWGNVTQILDKLDKGTDTDDLLAVVQYEQQVTAGATPTPHQAALLDAHVVDRARSIEVHQGTGTGPLLRRREGSYDDHGNLTSHAVWADPNGGTKATLDFEYDDTGFMTAVTDTLGYRVDYTPDALLNQLAATVRDSFGLESAAVFDYRIQQPLTEIDVNGQSQVSKYDDFGRLERVQGPYELAAGKASLEITYSVADSSVSELPVSATSTNVAVVPGTSNESTRLHIVTWQDPLGRTLQTQHDASVGGQPGRIVSGETAYDERGRRTEQGHPVFRPSGNFQLEAIATPVDRRTYWTYDALDRVTEVREPGDRKTTTTFTVAAHPRDPQVATLQTAITDPAGKRTFQHHDAAERLVAVVQRLDGRDLVTSYGYRPTGELISITDANGNVSTLDYDLAGRRVLVVTPDTGLLELGYDANGNLIERTDQALCPQPTNLLASCGPGQKIVYKYDLNRPTGISYPMTPDVTYTYGDKDPTGLCASATNALGRICHTTDEAGSELRSYGALGETVRRVRTTSGAPWETGERSYATELLYDSFGRLLSLTYPDGEILTYDYDAGGEVRAATGTKSGLTTSYVKEVWYDEFGQRTRLEFGNGVATRFAYDPTTRRLDKESIGPAGVSLRIVDYDYDKADNIVGIKDARGGQAPPRLTRADRSFSYDDLHRLTTATLVAQPATGVPVVTTSTFSYDDVGNLTAQRVVRELSGNPIPDYPSRDWAYSYPASGTGGGGGARPNLPTTVGPYNYRYDARGSIAGSTRIGTVGALGATYSWSEDARLRSSRLGTAMPTTQYWYDADGERIRKQFPAGTPAPTEAADATVYPSSYYTARFARLPGASCPSPPCWDQLVSRSKHVFLDGLRIATTAMVVDPSSTAAEDAIPVISTAHYFLHSDPLSSVSLVTDESGQRMQEIDYLPYGEVLYDDTAPSGSGTPQAFRFDGKELDPETGLQYFGARYYDPRIGRWLSADPLFRESPQLRLEVPKELALFAFGRANPINLSDPTGLAIPCPGGKCPFSVLDLPGPSALVMGVGRVGVGGVRLLWGLVKRLFTRRATQAGQAAARVAAQTAARATQQAATTVVRTGTARFVYGQAGRLESVGARILPQHLGTGTRTTQAARQLVRRVGQAADDAGHAIAKNLGGKGGATSGNIFPQAPSVNRGMFRVFEKRIADAVRAGSKVYIRQVYRYSSTTATRPTSILYQARIDGRTISQVFPNP